MKRALYDIWEEAAPVWPDKPWRVQMVNYVAQFSSFDIAERFIAAIKEFTKRSGVKSV